MAQADLSAQLQGGMMPRIKEVGGISLLQESTDHNALHKGATRVVLFCPVGKHRWAWDGKPIVLPRLIDEDYNDGVMLVTNYYPKPTVLGVCTCAFCHRPPVPEHRLPCCGLSPGDPSPWRENAVRILEDGEPYVPEEE